MRTLSELILEFVYKNKKKTFNVESDYKTLIKDLKKQGYKITIHDNREQCSYFEVVIEGQGIESSADSRANLRPRTLEEGVALAALKVFIPASNKRAHRDLIVSLGLDLTSFKRDFPEAL